ncbi:TonB-dependent receptor [Maribellus luteus]|nr:TonB-dependent receptor [Maribellus luteus]
MKKIKHGVSIFGNYEKLLLTMKLCLLLFFISTSTLLGKSVYSQNAALSLQLKDASFRDFVDAIEGQSEFIFVYYDGISDFDNGITIDVRNQSIEKILDEVFKSTDKAYKIIDRQIVIGTKNVTVEKSQVPDQNTKIKGTVTDLEGLPLPGVTITIVGTTRGVITDNDGTYSIDAKPSDKLVFSFIGMESQTIEVGNQSTINVKLKEKTEELDDVTVVAFGKQRKESVIASIETVKASDLKISSSNLTSAFAGKIPGVISYQSTGEPGADNAQFFVRGVTTFGYKSDPLILIDGFEASTNDLARIQPDDIESFSVLKDASATVLYGARGANGIIVVSTKSGAEGKVKISARVDFNVAKPTKMVKLLDGVEYMRLYNEALVSRYDDMEHGVDEIPTPPWYSEEKIRATERGDNPMIYPNVDWYDMLFKNGTTNTKANINLSGGGKSAHYYVAGGVDHETGLLKVDNQDNLNNFNSNINIIRVHLRSNVSFLLSPTTKLDTRIYGRFEKYNGPYTGASEIFNRVMDSNPVDFPAVWKPDARNLSTRWTLFGNADPMKTNPFAEMVRGYRENNESTISVQATLMQDLDFITPDLKLQLKASANTWNYNSGARRYAPVYYALEQYDSFTENYTLYNLTPNTVPYLGDTEASRDGNTHFYFEGRLNWDKTWDKHTVSLMTVGIKEQKILTNGQGGSIYYTLPERNLGNSGRFSYDYDKRYFVEYAYGYNGSEKFYGKKRFGFFPSYGLGWIPSNEAFWGAGLKNTISLLKFKFTYGKVGNDAIASREGRFFYLSRIVSGGGDYQWGRIFSQTYSGFQFARYANPDISWEVADKYNLGIEVGLFKDEALKLQVDLFEDHRNNIYMVRENFPETAGFQTAIHGNVGKVLSKGLDGSLDFKYSFNSDFWLMSRANFTYATNKYLEKDEKNYRDKYLSSIGHPINQTWGLVAERLFVDQAEIDNSPRQEFGSYMRGDIKYLDVNNDGVINSNDRIPMGYPTVPEIQYGFGMSAGYKDFDFSFFFQGNARVSFYINPEGIAPFVNRRNAPEIIARDSWSETHPDVHAFWPRLATYQVNNNIQQSSWWLREGSFLRLKTVELGYNLPFAKRLGMDSLRLYFSGENIFTVSSFKLWDPEMRGNGLAYPINRRFNVGLQLNF